MREERTDHIVITYHPDPYVERVVGALAERAELTYRQATEWFGDDLPATLRIEPPPDLSPEEPTTWLERVVLRAATASNNPAIEALGSYLAALHGAGPSVAEADGASAEQVTDPLSGSAASQISFIAFLQRSYGATALARFAVRARTEAPEQALARAYGQPAQSLIRGWRQQLRKNRGGDPAFGLVKGLLPLLRPHALRYVELAILVLVDLAAAMVMPLATKVLIDSILPDRNLAALTLWLVAVPASFVVGSLATYRRTVAAGVIGELLQRDLSQAAFDRLQALSLAFHARSRAGDLMSRVTNDVGQVKAVVGDTLPQLVYNVALLVVSTVALLLLNWLLGVLVLIVAIPVFSLIYARTSQSVMTASRDMQTAFGSAGAFLSENLGAQAVIKTFSLETYARHTFRQHLAGIYDYSVRAIRLSALLQVSTSLVFNALRVTVLAGGAVLVFNDRMSTGDLVALLFLVGQVLQPVMVITGQYRRLVSASASFDRVREVVEATPDVVEDPAAVDLPRPSREIRVDHVTLRYGESEAALRDVSVSIPIGSHIALVGPSGSGKSSLAGLLLRLYDPQHGRILIDNHDIRGVTLTSLRNQFGVVLQETNLFDATIHDNIAVGRLGATREDVEHAARNAAVDDAILRAEAGYESRVGERGVRLSGGQRQRLAIARALLRDPTILLLDEATSNLDPETEAAILGTLDDTAGGRTRIVITHRLSAAVRADRIYVLHHGVVVEQGTHPELLSKHGLYWRMYSEQSEAAPPAVDPATLREIPLLSTLTESELADFANRFSLESFPEDTFVVRQGEPADRLYVIAAGQVEVLLDQPAGPARRVRIMRERSYFGEIGLLDEHVPLRTASVRTRTDTRLYSLHRDDFRELLELRPRLAEAVSRLAGLRRRGDQ